jgi:hypothetical protein
MRQADHIIEIATADDLAGTTLHSSSRSTRFRENIPYAQRTLEMS